MDDPNWWLWLSENDTDREIKEVKDGLGSDGYVMVSQEDIVDSIASFIARYISSIPQAKVFPAHHLIHFESCKGFLLIDLDLFHKYVMATDTWLFFATESDSKGAATR